MYTTLALSMGGRAAGSKANTPLLLSSENVVIVTIGHGDGNTVVLRIAITSGTGMS